MGLVTGRVCPRGIKAVSAARSQNGLRVAGKKVELLEKTEKTSADEISRMRKK